MFVGAFESRSEATEKAKELVRMSAARATELTPLHRISVPVVKRALVIGGGVAGLEAALNLAEQEIAVDVLERPRAWAATCGMCARLSRAAVRWAWRDPQQYLSQLLARVAASPHITVHLGSELEETRGHQGNFTSKVRTPDGKLTLQHGATIVATGAREYRGPEYGLGSDTRILTQQDFEARLADDPESAGKLNSVVMIQCIGPAEACCTRTCCTVALKNAIRLKSLSPATQVAVLYQDLRTYGFKERLYTEARRLGVLFYRYTTERKPQLVPPSAEKNSGTEFLGTGTGPRDGAPPRLFGIEYAHDPR